MAWKAQTTSYSSGYDAVVLCDRLIPDVRLGARCMAVRVESDIGCVRQMARQTGFPTTDIKDLLPRSNDLGDPPEFGSCETRSIQCSVKVAAPIELQVKCLVAHQHRLEEGKPAGRFPQPEMFDLSELTICGNAKGATPQSNEQPGADRLNAAADGESGDGTQWNGLHRLTKIATGMTNSGHHNRRPLLAAPRAPASSRIQMSDFHH
jgi:hypothetical protein